MGRRTLLDAVLGNFSLGLLLLHTRSAVVVVVLGGGALGSVLALCCNCQSRLLVANLIPSRWVLARPLSNLGPQEKSLTLLDSLLGVDNLLLVILLLLLFFLLFLVLTSLLLGVL
jgi:hypothetical protein